MTKLTHTQRKENVSEAYSRSQRAIIATEEWLKSHNILDPALLEFANIEEKLKAIDAYREKFAEVYLRMLKEPSGPRPTIEYPKRTDWQQGYD